MSGRRKVLGLIMAVAMAGVLGCGGGDAVFGVNSVADDFDASVSGDEDSGTSTSVWINAGAQAEVSFSLGVGTTGGITLTIKDDGGTQVYRGTISSETVSSVDATTTAGTPGNWEVKIEASNLIGTASISLTRFQG